MARTGFDEGWSFRRKTTEFQELGGRVGQDWAPVRLPHDAVISTERDREAPGGDATGYFTGGAFQYRKRFTLDEADRGKRVLLVFEGVYRDAMVYVNSALAGQHALGYSRFAVRIDPFLNAGAENEVRVDCRTHVDNRWYTGAGIHRGVQLVVQEPLHVAHDGVRVTTPDIEADRALVEVATTVENSGLTTATPVLHVAVLDAAGTEVARSSSPVTVVSGESAVVRRRLVVDDPARWSVDSPALYTARVELREGEEVLDSETVAFGIRTLQLDAQRGLRINGEEVKLRGACIHSDNGPLGAAAFPRADERKVELLKEAGFNAVRSAHNPLSSAALDACDRLGVIVMDESFDVWTSSKSDFDHSFEFPSWWERDLAAMVAKDVNHPSVVFYSIGNEIPETGTPHGGRWSRRLAEKVRELDPTRFVTNGINPFVSVIDLVGPALEKRRAEAAAAGESGGGATGVNGMMNDAGGGMGAISAAPMVTARTEESFAVLDAAGMNYADSRYEMDRELFPDRVIVGTETWATSIAGNWALVEAHPHVIGDFTWTGIDYLGETGIGVVKYADAVEGVEMTTGDNRYPGLTAFCGDLDITGFRRPVSYYRETVFGLRHEPYIAVFRPESLARETAGFSLWGWSDAISSWSWEGHEGAPARVEVYSDAEEVELRLDDEVIGRAKVGDPQPFRATFDLTYRPGTLTAVAYTGGERTGEAVLTSAAPDLVLRAGADRSELAGDGADLAFVELVLTDAAGHLHNDRDRSVTVTVDGPAVLAALGSGQPVTEETFSAPSHRTFDGRALAVVRATGPGAITVTATADGVDPAVVTLSAS